MKEHVISLLRSLRQSANSADRLFLLFALFASFVVTHPSRADEPFFKKDDVIAIMGGEDMVAMSEYGYLELLLTRALPEHRLKFRNLAWEGDTVFEQRRDLNFPPLEAQLDQVGATVVICQFGQMESLAASANGLAASGRVGVPPAVAGVPPGTPPGAEGGKMPPSAGETPTLPGLKEFIAAYEKLIARMSGGGKRKIGIICPTRLGNSQSDERWGTESVHRMYELVDKFPEVHAYNDAAEALAKRSNSRFLDLSDLTIDDGAVQYDGVHLSEDGQRLAAFRIGLTLTDSRQSSEVWYSRKPEVNRLLTLIRAKNKLWFDYWRVQNWAFLAGDRTEQPSSRDHVDRTKRWFPAEREQFLPLIEAKEQEIWALAAKLARP